MTTADPQQLTRLAALIRLRDASTFEGERVAAQNAIDKLLRRHPGLNEALAREAEWAAREVEEAAAREAAAREAQMRASRFGFGNLHTEGAAHFSEVFERGTVRTAGAWHDQVAGFAYDGPGSVQRAGAFQFGAWNRKW